MNDMTQPRQPWLNEPDFKKWIDPETGLLCAIVRVDATGSLCGYVRLPHGKLLNSIRNRMRIPDGYFLGHLIRKRAYDHPKLSGIYVHGGLTFGGRFAHYRMNRGIWLGFDCAHYGDASPKTVLLSNGVYRDMAYVTDQVTAMAKQLSQVSK